MWNYGVMYMVDILSVIALYVGYGVMGLVVLMLVAFILAFIWFRCYHYVRGKYNLKYGIMVDLWVIRRRTSKLSGKLYDLIEHHANDEDETTKEFVDDVKSYRAMIWDWNSDARIVFNRIHAKYHGEREMTTRQKKRKAEETAWKEREKENSENEK